MRVLFVIAFLCFLNSTRANNYYFSSLSGNDSRTISQAQDPSTPWKTLDKLNSFFSSLKPGDQVLLKRGETFYGSIIVKQSGSTTLPVVIGAYGSGAKPVITSLVTLTGWTSKGNGIWESYNSSFGASVNMVLLNGIEYGMGRYPNNDAANNGYLNFESHVGKTSITDNQLSTAINWTGAELVLRPRHWILDRNLITSQSGTTISYSSSLYEPFENYGYFIQNSIKTLDKFGEWYYNPSTKKLSVFFGSNSPSSYVLEAATMGDLISSDRFSNILFENLAVRGSNGSAFNIHSGSGISVQNCDILFSGANGFAVRYHANLKIENCLISDQNNNGIDLETGDNAIIRNNTILNSYRIAGMGLNGEGMGIGINIFSNNCLVEYNEIRNTGFQGIFFNGNDVTIKNNLIDSFCITKDDGAGIYSTKGAVIFKRRKVIGNIILNGIGTGKGTADSNKVAAHGIYLDNNASEVDIRDNTIANCSNNGINIHNSFGMGMENNTVFNNTIQLNMVQDADNVAVRNCTLTGNILFSEFPEQWVSMIASSANDIKSFGQFDSNYYARPLDDKIIINSSYVASNGTRVTQNFDLDGWKVAYGLDANSKKTAKQIAPFTITGLIGNNLFVNGGDFTNDIKGISGNSCTLSQGTSGLLDGGYLQIAPTSATPSFFFKVGSVTKGKSYMLSYSLKGSADTDMSIGAGLRLSGPPYAAITPVQSRKIDIARTENEMLFSPSSTQSSTSVVFKMDNKNKFYVDNIKFYEANAKITNPGDSIRFEYNATNINKSLSLSGNYIDTKGKIYSNGITLAPYTSVILIKTNSGAQNIAPTVTITTPANNAVLRPFSKVSINAAAADVDGSISKVEFYNGSTLLKTEYKPGYDCILDSLAPGNYRITAKATDNKGLATTSSLVAFLVTASNMAPFVNITSPTIISNFSAPATIEIIASATDTDGSINKVEFYNGTTLLTTERKFPYTYAWQNVAAGNYTITAKATDNNGLTTTSTVVRVSVKAPQAARVSSSQSSLVTSDTLSNAAANGAVESMPGSGNGSAIENHTLSGQPDLFKLADFRVFPNPAVHMIRLYFDGLQTDHKANLVIRNLSGATVKKYAVTISGSKIDVDISSLLPGIYIIGLSGDNFIVNKKFLKVN